MCAVYYVCLVSVVSMYGAVSMYGMYVVCTLYVQCGIWCDVCGVVGFYHVHTAFLLRPYEEVFLKLS